MTINGQGSSSLLDSVLDSQSTRNDMAVAVLKKAQDVQKQQGEALVQMLEQSGPASPRLDAYA
jgi:hypothetical protein